MILAIQMVVSDRAPKPISQYAVKHKVIRSFLLLVYILVILPPLTKLDLPLRIVPECSRGSFAPVQADRLAKSVCCAPSAFEVPYSSQVPVRVVIVPEL